MALSGTTFEQLMAAALGSYNAGRHAEAEAACRLLLSHAPRHPAVHQLLAVLALTANDINGARIHIVRSLTERPDHAPSLILAGKIARAEGELATAVQYFERSARLAPGAVEPDFLLGATLAEMSSPAAIPVLQRLLDRHQQHAEAWCLLGIALRRHPEAGSALDAFRRAAQCDPHMARAHFHVGTELFAQGRAAEAIPVFRRARELDPTSMEIVFNLGTALHALGEVRAACTAFEEAVAAAPDFADAWFNLGLARQDLHELDGAAAAFRAALARRPDYAEAAVNLGIVLQEAHLMDDAMEAYRMAIRLRPGTFGRIAHALAGAPAGRLWLSVGDLKRALGA